MLIRVSVAVLSIKFSISHAVSKFAAFAQALIILGSVNSPEL